MTLLSSASWLSAICTSALLSVTAAAQNSPEITFNKNFEAGALGKIEATGTNQFRCHVEGQCDEHGRNRQANWYYFRMDHVKGREIILTLTDLVGEYNGRPGACPMTAETIPVFSDDNLSWQHFPAMTWDDQKKEATLHFRPERESIWFAHVPPYPYSRLTRLLAELDERPSASVEVIGKSAQGRDLHLVTVTDPGVADTGKRTVWLIGRQHAWETGTSYVMEGALRFVTSDDPQAQALRRQLIFKFTPTMDPDGCANGKVRFNANGYDLNRHWDEVDLRMKEFLAKLPEIWYVKKSIVNYQISGRSIDLLVNMHNDELPEYMDTMVTDEAVLKRVQRFADALGTRTSFDPTQGLRVNRPPDHTTNWLWPERKIPVLTMEQRIAPSRKLGRQATADDRLKFGRELINEMAQAALTP